MTIPWFASVIFSLLILLGSGLILFQARRSGGRFLNRVRLRRAVFELVVLNAVVLSPLMVLMVISLVSPGEWVSAAWVSDLTLGIDMAAPIMISLIYPIWFLVRPLDSIQRLPIRTMLAFLAFSLLTALFYYVLGPPLIDLIQYGQVLAPEPRALPLGLLVVGLGTAVLLALFGLREFLSISKRAAIDTAVLSHQAEKDRSPTHWLLIGLGLLALVLWAVSLAYYFYGPERAYLTPIFQGTSQSILLSSVTSPIDRPAPVILLTAAASLGMILFSLFFSIYVQPAELSARLFTWLALLYGLSSIDIFPPVIGPVLFTLVLFGRIMTMPVQIYFAWLFPQADLTTDRAKRRRVALIIFIPFLVMSGFWIYFFLQSEAMMAAVNNLLASREAAPEALPDSFINDALKLSFWFLSAVSFFFANALTWLLSAWFIFRTYRQLSGRFEAQKTDTTLSADLKERVAAAWMQVKWFSFGVGLSASILLIFYFLFGALFGPGEGWADVFTRFGLLAMFAFAALAIRRYRLWDVDELINRGRAFLTLAAGLLIIYGVVAWLSTRLAVTTWLGLSPQEVVLTISPLVALILVVIFGRVYQPLQERLERRFDRTQFDFNKTLAEVSEKLSRTVGTAALNTLLTETIPRDLQIEYAHIEPVPSQAANIDTLVADQMTKGAALALPLTVGERTSGLYVIGPRRSGQKLGTKAQNLFRTMSYQAATAFENSRTWEALLDEYEIRNQIVHDVHDNLSSELTIAQLFLDQLQLAGEDRDRPLPEPYLGAVNSLYSMRRDLNLVMAVLDPNLRPASVNSSLTDKLNELAALFAKAGKFSYRFAADEGCNRCSPRLQQTVWVITREALTNIVKHADATLVSIQLACDAQRLITTIEDDGIGFDSAKEAGRGLPSMRRRAERVGGELTVESAPGQGTKIKLTIPGVN
jgi:signal transduction histidine kinase